MQWIVRRRRFVPLCGMALIAAVAVTGCGGRSRRHVTISVDRPSALADVPVAVVVHGLHPKESVEVTASGALLARQFGSSARFTADSRGTVDLARATPMPKSSYESADGMGLFWSLVDHGPAPRPGPVGRYTITLSVGAGGHEMAHRDVTRLLESPGENKRDVTLAGDGFEGALFTPAAVTHQRAVVVFGGSEGGFGVSKTTAAMLAAHGYPALAVAYFGMAGLPAQLSGIPLEYFTKAAAWLSKQPAVDPGEIWVLGGSRGSEAALLLAAHFPNLFHGVIASAPSSLVFSGLGGGSAWTLNGVPLPSVSPVLADISRLGNGISERAAFAAAFSDPAERTAVIPVENIHGPVLTVAGEDDQLWPSAQFAERIHARLDEHHFAFAHENLVYPGAGHLVFGIPYTLAGPTFVEHSGIAVVLGGTPAANEAAHVDDWPKVLAFIAQH